MDLPLTAGVVCRLALTATAREARYAGARRSHDSESSLRNVAISNPGEAWLAAACPRGFWDTLPPAVTGFPDSTAASCLVRRLRGRATLMPESDKRWAEAALLEPEEVDGVRMSHQTCSLTHFC
ncbi:hypothetical protein AAFF_G00087190 [Aldrovandia affinis]|uniref:Uncharacterized protein n=1 Tax=Aldrovandia affinis TaxID=143900 RepID=A0AAD7RWQ8_9TELE|nr:hypothetical protein AAFF_G00087190 [Aldrovandia affinis]